MKHIIKSIKILMITVAICAPAAVMAQPGFDDDVNDVPVDGGLSLLAAAGIGYGAKKLNDRRKKTQSEKEASDK